MYRCGKKKRAGEKGRDGRGGVGGRKREKQRPHSVRSAAGHPQRKTEQTPL